MVRGNNNNINARKISTCCCSPPAAAGGNCGPSPADNPIMSRIKLLQSSTTKMNTPRFTSSVRTVDSSLDQVLACVGFFFAFIICILFIKTCWEANKIEPMLEGEDDFTVESDSTRPFSILPRQQQHSPSSSANGKIKSIRNIVSSLRSMSGSNISSAHDTICTTCCNGLHEEEETDKERSIIGMTIQPCEVV